MRNLFTALTRPFRRNNVRARYESGWWSTWRSPILTFGNPSAAKDIAADRPMLADRALHWDQNDPQVHGLFERLSIYTIGTGLIPVAASSSQRWNKAVTRAWDEWALRPEITDRFSWGTLQRVCWRSALRDGDCFILLTAREDGSPALQMIEARRIGNGTIPPATPDDGVLRDSVGRHLGYRLLREDGLVDRVLDGGAVVQILFVERPDQPRGVSLFASALKRVHNLDDILRLEQLAVKDASGKTDIIKTATGELPIEDIVRMGEGDIPPVGQDAAGYYHTVFGPETKVLRHGDEFTPYEPKRPSPAWQGFVSYLSDSIAYCTGIPPSVLLPGKLGGADTRKDLAAASRVLESWQWSQADAYQKVYEYVVGTWISSGRVGNAPKDWRKINWQMPRSITADAGHEASADIERVAAGLLTLEDYFGQQGYDGKQKVEQLASEQALVNELDPSGKLAMRLYARPGAAAAPPQSSDEETEEEPDDESADDQRDEPGEA